MAYASFGLRDGNDDLSLRQLVAPAPLGVEDVPDAGRGDRRGDVARTVPYDRRDAVRVEAVEERRPLTITVLR